ncbi:MAG: hypothetical protein Q8L63_03190, partial [Alphaproteobacteria bacterium]|nr:hypothetical protein [Alphaproteobacteria bacterium]
LTEPEREQILYNHMKAGTQPSAWKARIKGHLLQLSKQSSLLPEIARRLGDKDYTGNIARLPEDLLSFVAQPQEFLVQTFKELAPDQQAAMTLVFLAQSRLPVHRFPDGEATLVATSYGVTKSQLTQALMQLEGSFVIRRSDGDNEYWAFWHPTFADAISEILSRRPDLINVYVRGARLDTLLTEVVCEDAPPVRDAVVVPLSSHDALIKRLLETPDDAAANEQLFEFLNRRVTKALLHQVLQQDPDLLGREGQSPHWQRLRSQETIRIRTKAYAMGLLSDEVRFTTVCTLEDGALYKLDASFVGEDSILEMFSPSELMRMTAGLLAKLDSEISKTIGKYRDEADPDSDIDSQFEKVSNFLDDIQELATADKFFETMHDCLMDELKAAKAEVEAEKTQDEGDTSFFNSVPRAVQRVQQGGRSIFSDVDE